MRLPAWQSGEDVQVIIQDDRVLRPWVRLKPQAEFSRDSLLLWMLLAAICAVLLTVILSMYSYARRNRTVAAYVVYVAGFLWWIVQEFGVDSAWFSGLVPLPYFVEVQCVSVALVILGIGWTMLEFLALQGTARLVIGGGQLLSAGAFVAAIWWPPGYRAGSMVLAANAVLTMVFLLRQLRGADLANRLFTTGFAVAMVGGGIQSLSVAMDLGEFSNFAVYAYAVGGFAQVAFWLVAIAHRLQREREQLVRWRQEELEQQVAQATAELLQKKEIAEDAMRAKADFLAAASHDLRQPTHALGMLIARLGQFHMGAEMHQVYGSLEASVSAIQELLDELMDYSILDASSQKTDLRPTPLEPLLASLRETLTPLAAAKGLALRIRATDLVVRSDPAMLRRMVQNLALNAIRYTERGAVLIACRPAQAGQAVRIEVWDSGIGIAPDQQQHIFKEFFQVGNVARERHKGIGLGLSIVQRSAQLLDHNIVLRSNLGCGSRFGIVAPRESACPPAPVPVRDTLLESSSLVGLEVLLVEDDAMSRSALTDLLQSWGCSVRACQSGAQALAGLAGQPQPHIMLSDFRLDDASNGLELILALRQALGKPVPACLVSGDLSTTLLDQARAHNILLLHKPLRPAKLRSLLRRLQAAARAA